jgi:class 3 adenylate cyclase
MGLSRSSILLVNSLARSKSECLNFNALGGGRGDMSQTRRLAAILAADVAGYSRLMGADEEGTLERLKALWD